MASNGAMNGTLVLFDIGGTPISNLTSNNMGFTRAAIDVSNKGSGGWAEFIYGQGGGSFDCEGVFKEDATYGWEELFAAMLAKTVLTLRWTSDVIGDKYYEGSVLIESANMDAPLEDKITYTCTLKLTGAPTTGTIA